MEEEPGIVCDIVVSPISLSLSVLFFLIFWWVWKDVERILAELRSIHTTISTQVAPPTPSKSNSDPPIPWNTLAVWSMMFSGRMLLL